MGREGGSSVTVFGIISLILKNDKDCYEGIAPATVMDRAAWGTSLHSVGWSLHGESHTSLADQDCGE